MKTKLFFCFIIFIFFIYIVCFASKLIDNENFFDGIFFIICGFIVFEILLKQIGKIIEGDSNNLEE